MWSNNLEWACLDLVDPCLILLLKLCPFALDIILRICFSLSTAIEVVFQFQVIFILARACGVPAVGVRAVDCWQ